jgi:salicylate hydroxylase
MKVIIAGGGIGGLSAALCLIHYGHEPIILERASAFGEVGAGLQIPPNAMKVFQALDLDAALGDVAFEPIAIEGRMGVSGRELFKIPLGQAAVDRWGAPYLHIHRADYIAVLEAAFRNAGVGACHFDAEVIGYRQSGCHVTARLKDGREVQGDVLIGADGIQSAVRMQMLGPGTPRFTGNVAWRAVVPMETLGDLAPRPTVCAWMGAGRHCVTYRLRQGRLANFVGVVERDDWQVESWTERGTQAEALADFPDWHPMIDAILKQAKAPYRWALFDRLPLERWVEGRVALLGDAAHPMLPFMAQGAAMAVEDSWVLARALSSFESAEDALKAYQTARFERTARVQAGSRANAKTFHKSTRLSQLATYGPMWLAGRMAPSLIQRRQDWIYGYDVRAAE